ncbi:MAG TPA: hypothetical protein VHB30_12505 [Solirubrobacteraceae bacterium]|jgi:hypothetical protein|nr:hypothetical protein [Solirubrobacteraceae bacterium]
MGWTFVWLMVGLKVPILALFLLVRWAVLQTDEEQAPPSDDGGIRPHDPHPWDGPLGPRVRGPHGDRATPAPTPRNRQPAHARTSTAARH